MLTPEFLSRFPPILPEKPERQLFFDFLDAETQIALITRRYDPVAIATMPVVTQDERRAQLQGISQGLADGTIEATTARLKGIELAMRNLGMLSDKNRAEKVSTRDPESVEDLISALKGFQGNTLRDAQFVNRKAILEEYGNSGTIRETSGKIRATKKIKREKQ